MDERLKKLMEVPAGHLGDRYVQKIQFRIQELIDLKDDEIDRLAKQLTEYQRVIMEKQDALKRLQYTLDIKSSEINGMDRKTYAEGQSLIAKKVSDHHERMMDLQDQYQNEVKAIQYEFETTLKRFHKFSQEQFEEQEDGFNREVADAVQELNEARQALAEAMDESTIPENSAIARAAEVDANHISRLQKIVMEKNEERKVGLYRSREQLQEIVSMLDEMSRKHEAEVEVLKNRINEDYTAYQNALQAMKRERNVRMRSLRQTLARSSERSKNLQGRFRQVKEEQDKRLAQSTNEFMEMRERVALRPVDVNIGASEQRKVDKKKMRMQRTQVEFAQKERRLDKAKKENMSLVRSVAQAKHFLRFKDSGVALNV